MICPYCDRDGYTSPGPCRSCGIAGYPGLTPSVNSKTPQYDYRPPEIMEYLTRPEEFGLTSRRRHKGTYPDMNFYAQLNF